MNPMLSQSLGLIFALWSGGEHITPCEQKTEFFCLDTMFMKMPINQVAIAVYMPTTQTLLQPGHTHKSQDIRM